MAPSALCLLSPEVALDALCEVTPPPLPHSSCLAPDLPCARQVFTLDNNSDVESSALVTREVVASCLVENSGAVRKAYEYLQVGPLRSRLRISLTPPPGRT